MLANNLQGVPLLPQLIYSLLMRNLLPSSEQLQTMLECLSVVLQKPELVTVIGQKEQATWVCTAIRTVHQLLTSSKSEVMMYIISTFDIFT